MVAALKPGGWIVIEDFDAPLIDVRFLLKMPLVLH